MKTIYAFILLLMIPFSTSGYLLPSRLFFRLESGFGFSTYSSINQGINNTSKEMVILYGLDAEGKDFKQLDFDIPIMLKVGFRPFNGKIGKNIVTYVRTGYILTYSLNNISLTTTSLNYEYKMGILPFEIGAEYQLLRMEILGLPLSFYGGLGAGIYWGFFSKNDNGDLQKYSGSSLGINVSFTTTLQISRKLSIVGNIHYRYANISTLKNNHNEQLYISDTGFLTSQTQPPDTSAAQINLSGLGISFGIQFSLGDKRLTDIPEGVYR